MVVQQPLSAAEFYASLFLAREGIERTLNVSISTPESEFAESAQTTLQNAIELHTDGHLLERDFQVGRLKMFVKHLVEIQSRSLSTLPEFQNKVDEMGYHGMRFEIDICASLLRKEVSFQHPDPPDFRIDSDGTPISIECSSSHLETRTNDFETQIKDLVAAKSDKPYFEPETALFADITNLYYRADLAGVPLDQEQIKSWVRKRMELPDNELEIGSILLFFYFGNPTGMGVSHHYLRIDNEPIAPELESFLENHFPISPGTNPNPWIFATP